MRPGGRPAVVVVDEALPWPTDSGKRIRTFELMRRLAPDFDIVFVHHREGGPDPDGEAALRDAGIEPWPVPRRPLVKRGPRFAWDLLRNVAMPVPYMVMAHRTRALRTAVGDVVRTRDAALVHVEWTPLVANVPDDVGRPVVIAAHNVEATIWDRYREHEPPGPRRAYVALQGRKVRRFERRALRAADGVVAVSEEDATRIRRDVGRDDVVVAPNGVDPERFAPRPGVVTVPRSLVFVGSLDWRPNLDGVSWLLDAVWPRVRAAAPDATLVVVGRRPPDALRRRLAGEPGVRLEASVPDVRPHVAAAAVSVVPLRIGGGSRLKICEALAMARPVVSTTVGAEGLDLGDGLVRADTGEAFAAAVLGAFADPAAALDRARRGRERVLLRYAWDRIAPIQADLWRRLAAAGRRERAA